MNTIAELRALPDNRIKVDERLQKVLWDSGDVAIAESTVKIPAIETIEFETFISSGETARTRTTTEAMRSRIGNLNKELILPEQFIELLTDKKHLEVALSHISKHYSVDMVEWREYVLIPTALPPYFSGSCLIFLLDPADGKTPRLTMSEDWGSYGFSGVINVPVYSLKPSNANSPQA